MLRALWPLMPLLFLLPGATIRPAPVPAVTAVHVGDLDDQTDPTSGGTGGIIPTVGVWVHGPDHRGVYHARVEAAWGGSVTGTARCETDQDGYCRLQTRKPYLNEQGLQIVLRIRKVEGDGLEYDKSANHDPDRDSDGTVIRITR